MRTTPKAKAGKGDAVTTTAAVVALPAALVGRIGQERYDAWFATRTRFAFDGERLVVGVPNLHFQDWLGKRFKADVEAAARAAFGHPVPVQFRIDAPLFQELRAEQQVAAAATPLPALPAQVAQPALRAQAATGSPEPKYAEGPPPTLFDAPKTAPVKTPRTPRKWRTLGEFVVGPCNRVAFAAAQSAVETPGDGPSPLVVHGPVGTGKTHLLEAVYVGLRRAAPDWRVSFLTAEEFTNRFVQASRFQKMQAFRKQFRDCDALLLDDLHFLAGKKATQDEFLHTFDSLLNDGRTLVVTCDCHPRLTEDFAPELADRLLAGAVWGLQPPDPATRLDLLRSKSAKASLPIRDDVLAFLAQQLRGNVRELEGALNSLKHYSRVTGRPVDVPLAREALGDLLRHAVRVVALADVDAAVCGVLRLPPGTLQSKARAWSVSHPRMLAVFLSRKHTAASYGEIGLFFGGRNHSTAVAAEKRVRGWLAKNDTLTLQERPWRVRELVELAERHLGR
jgi:chromosomal replication initiator protein